MGRVTSGGRVAGLVPAAHSDEDFMTRIQLALDKTPKQLANSLDVPTMWMVDRYGSRAQMTNWLIDPFWDMLRDYVNERIAGLIAVKEELDRKERLDRREYEERRRAIKNG